jgi:Amt family ammonium transporter
MSEMLDNAWVLICAFLVFFMQVGFALLEVGSVQAKNAKSILIKNLLDGAVGTVAWWLFGWGIAFGGQTTGDDTAVAGNLGELFATNDRIAALADVRNGWAYWFFQWTFATTAATIVSGSMAERCDSSAYLYFSFVMTGFIYPLPVHWCWTDAGWLNKLGYVDFAGCGPVSERAKRAQRKASERKGELASAKES